MAKNSDGAARAEAEAWADSPRMCVERNWNRDDIIDTFIAGRASKTAADYRAKCEELARARAELETEKRHWIQDDRDLNELLAENERLREALAKIHAIRNDIITNQTINWSAHIYPLVAALKDAGYDFERTALTETPP